jgi:hypothetical protein
VWTKTIHEQHELLRNMIKKDSICRLPVDASQAGIGHDSSEYSKIKKPGSTGLWEK